MWLTDRHFFLLAVAVYGLSTLYSVFLWRRGFRHHDRAGYLLLLAAFGLHTTAMLQRGFLLSKCPVHNLYEATAFIGWAVVAAYLVLGLWSRLRFLSAFVSPLLFGMGVFGLMPGLDPPHAAQPDFAGGLVSLHAALALLAYGAFGVSAASAIMYLVQAHDLKLHKLRAVFALLPPLQRLETITSGAVLAGFLLLSAGLLVGGLLPRPEGVSYFRDAKVIWSCLLWLAYLAVLLARWMLPLAGRWLARASIWAFVFVLLTFWGTNLLSPLHNR